MTESHPAKVFTLLAHVQPRARATAIVGWHGDGIKFRVRAAPSGGAANDELIGFLARRLGLTRAAISIVGGKTARRKHIRVQGIRRTEALSLLGLGEPPPSE